MTIEAGSGQQSAATISGKRLGARMGWLPFALFFLSGSCALGYESLWARYLGLFLGNTVLLHMTVLGTFMGGLAGGAFLIGSRVSRAPSPLRMYGALELAIAVWGFCFPLAARVVQNVSLGAGIGSSATAVKVVGAMMALLPPTLLMGATWPALTAYVERRHGQGVSGANCLYALNCAGAALGALTTGFLLIPSLGLTGSTLTIAAVNAAIGVLPFFIRGEPVTRAVEEARPDLPPALLHSATRKAVLAAISLSGAAAFIYELVWTRLFALTLGGSTYSFTLMLAAFITGLALGSGLGARLRLSQRASASTLALCEAGIGCAVAVSIPFYQRLPFWFWHWKYLLRPVEESVWLFHLMEYGLTFAVMLVPTFLFGLSFPLAISAISSRETPVSTDAALVYGWNTAGTIAGVFSAGLILVPLLGLQTTLQTASALNLVISVLIALRAKTGVFTQRMVSGSCMLGVLVLLLSPAWHPMALAQGPFRQQTRPPASWSAFVEVLQTRRVMFSEEDFGTTVTVVGGKGGSAEEDRLLVVDGKTDASSYGDMPTQILLGQIPMLLHPRARSVFILGLGSGVTLGSVLTHPVERVDCVELAPGVVRAAGFFADVNHDALKDPRVRLIVDDGKTALASSSGSYDAIISEPPNPWMAGVGNMFSREFYRTAASRLNHGGTVTQWLHSYEFDDHLVATIVRTFRETFPHAVIFQGGENDFILVGSRESPELSLAEMESRISEPRVSADLARINLERMVPFLSHQTHSQEATAMLGEGGEINTDDMPLLEFRAPLAQYSSSFARRIVDTDCRLKKGGGLWLGEWLSAHPLEQTDLDATVAGVSDPRVKDTVLGERILRFASARWPHDPRYPAALARLLAASERFGESLPLAETAARSGREAEKALRAWLLEKVRERRESVFDEAR